ncbi:hypothetical protein GCM10009678_34810 [Actinomadura kijaniata]|uniref:Uncharacterized protein n=1 Tax=Actinomadura namibiensis TaxID=182080 RepID=A0A7W3QS14_ACTNM|nr:hypothetical protein [Actinomadura namibiensis]MBA8956953.1 hypothetical protein [Actinomadura namibiensis]
MTAHLSDSDRQALRLAHDLREELRQALPGQAAPSISPFVDPSGRPSVLMRMDADTAHALMALLGERRAAPADPRRTEGMPLAAPAPPPASPPPFPGEGTLYGGSSYPGSTHTGPMPTVPGGMVSGGAMPGAPVSSGAVPGGAMSGGALPGGMVPGGMAQTDGFGGAPRSSAGFGDPGSTGTGGLPLMPSAYPGR